MLFEDKLADILNTLESGKLLLAPIEFCWALVYDPTNRDAIRLASQLGADFHDPPFLLHDNITTLKKTYPLLHPRIETLLVYHRRPLGILASKVSAPPYTFASQYALCLTFDPYAQHLVRMLGSPLACHYCSSYGKPATSLSDIPSHIISKASYISKHRNKPALRGLVPVVVTYDSEGAIIAD